MKFTVRQFRDDEAASYRDIRLEALRLHPEAFGSAFEQESLQPLSAFGQRLEANAIFGGFHDGQPFGTAGFMPESGLKRAHKAHFWGMYVRASARGTGLARRLVEAVLEHAQGRAELLQLSVIAGNAPAVKLYESLGFTPYGQEYRSLKVDGVYYDEILMMKPLT
jgi:GNAT superfamily N-acetyltransferase